MRSDIIHALEIIRQQGPEDIERALIQLQGTVFSFSMKLCGNRQDAEDTTQETLLKVLPYLRRFERPEALGLWLYKTAKTRCLMSRRRSKFAPHSELSVEELIEGGKGMRELAAPTTETPENVVLRQETQELLDRAVLQLPAPSRLALVLHDMEGLSTKETAEVLGLREGTVRVRLHRARLFLRDELAKDGAGEQPGNAAPPRSRRLQQLTAKLSEYLDDRLGGTLCEELEKHLAGCERCQQLLESLERTVEQCRRRRDPAADPREAAECRKILLDRYCQLLSSTHAAGVGKQDDEALPSGP